jgi:hypothetical protein
LFTIETYIQSVRESLQNQSASLIEELSKTLQFHFSEKVDLVDFTAFMQPFGLSIMMFSMDKGANEVFYEGTDSSIFAGSYEVLENTAYYPEPENQSEEFEAFYEQHDEALSTVEAEVITEWFAACWNQAGGGRMKLPAYFSFHDYDHCFDLHKGKWISDEDKWF